MDVIRGIADTMVAAGIRHRYIHFALLQYRRDLRVDKSRSLHFTLHVYQTPEKSVFQPAALKG